jgi:hypothetical protein
MCALKFEGDASECLSVSMFGCATRKQNIVVVFSVMLLLFVFFLLLLLRISGLQFDILRYE